MSRSEAGITQADIARALRAARQVGTTMAVDILKDGTIRLFPVSGLQSARLNPEDLGDKPKEDVDVSERPVL